MSNTSPYEVLTSTMMVDTNAYTGNRQLKGLHVSSINVILAAFLDTISMSSGVFEIGTIDFGKSEISFKETLPAMTVNDMGRVVFLSDTLYFGASYGTTMNTN